MILIRKRIVLLLKISTIRTDKIRSDKINLG
jgi:hypothetical protein